MNKYKPLENREVDIRIAQEIFGRKVEKRYVWCYTEGGDYMVPRMQMLIKVHPDESRTDMNGEVWIDPSWEEWEDLPRYSEDVGAALTIIETMSKPQWGKDGVWFEILYDDHNKYAVDLSYWVNGKKHESWGNPKPTLAEAIVNVVLVYLDYNKVE